MNEIINRLKSPTPDFFNKVKILAGAVVSIALAIEAVAATGLQLPAELVTIAHYTIAFGVAMGFTAQLPKKDVGQK